MQAVRKASENSTASAQDVAPSLAPFDATSDVAPLYRRGKDLVEINQRPPQPPAGNLQVSQSVRIHDDLTFPSLEKLQSQRPGRFSIASLNVGGRNTNALEFALDSLRPARRRQFTRY